MSEPVSRTWEIFFEVYEALPRQGPGSRACAARALGICRELPPSPTVLDLGCGVGGQTLYLAELTGGSIIAVDRHAPMVTGARARAERLGVRGVPTLRAGDQILEGLQGHGTVLTFLQQAAIR